MAHGCKLWHTGVETENKNIPIPETIQYSYKQTFILALLEFFGTFFIRAVI